MTLNPASSIMRSFRKSKKERRKKHSSSSLPAEYMCDISSFHRADLKTGCALPKIVVTKDVETVAKDYYRKIYQMEKSSPLLASTSDASVISCTSAKLHDDSPDALQSFSSMPNMTLSSPNQKKRSHAKIQNGRVRRKFLKHFKEVWDDEVILNSYSCALLSDILLQGNLYITTHRFAFHSKIFGYETIKLLPLADVVKIKKQKTVKIIPNAIGIYTSKTKYIFGSLIARNVTFKLMCHVLKTSINESSLLDVDDDSLLIPEEEDEDSCTGSGDNNVTINSTESASGGSELEHSEDDNEEEVNSSTIRKMSSIDLMSARRKSTQCEKGKTSTIREFCSFMGSSRQVSAYSLLLVTLALLVFLIVCASLLLYRLHQVQRMAGLYDPLVIDSNLDAKELYRLQELRHQKAMKRLQSSLEVHILQLNQVRNALEMLVKGIPKMAEESQAYEKLVLTPMHTLEQDKTKVR